MDSKEAQAIREELLKVSADGRVGCREALEAAGRLDVDPRLMSKAANELGVKIVACQLGCF